MTAANSDDKRLTGRGFRRLALVFGGLSVVATVILIFAVGGPGVILEALATMDARYLALVALAIVVEWVTDIFRYYTTALALGVRLDTRLVVRITFANLFFAYLTPGGGFGAPVVTYMLYRRGISLPRSIAIALIKPLISLFVLIPGLTLMTVFGGSEFVGLPALQVVIAGTGGLAWTVIMALLVAAIWPRLTSRVVDGPLRWIGRRRFVQRRFPASVGKVRDGVHQTIDAFGLYLRGGWFLPLMSFLAAIANVGALCGIGVALLVGFHATGGQVQLWGLSLLYVAVISVSPTPGASGIAEGSGMAIFDGVFATDEQVAAFVLLWRLLTCYLPLVIGALMFAQFLGETPLKQVHDLSAPPAAADPPDSPEAPPDSPAAPPDAPGERGPET